MKRLLLFLALLVVPTLSLAAKYADCVARGSTTKAEADFRNSHYQLHIGQVGAYKLAGLTFEYVMVPPQNTWIEWMVSGSGRPPLKLVAGRNFYDLSDSTTVESIAIAIKWRLDSLKASGTEVTGIFVDCPLFCASGQQWDAVTMLSTIKSTIAPYRMMVNFGDLWTWCAIDPLSPWAAVERLTTDQFVQVAMVAGGKNLQLFQFSRMVATAQTRASSGKTVVLGVHDPNGDNATYAASFLGSQGIAAAPTVYLYYQTAAYSMDSLRDWQWCKALPEPVVPTPVELGINSDLKGLSVYQLPDNWWNLRVNSAPVDSNSPAIITFIKGLDSYNGRLHPDFTPSYGIPYVVVSGDAAKSSVSFAYASESDAGPYPIPVAAKTDNSYYENHENYFTSNRQGDAHMLLLDRDNWFLYELSYLGWDGSKWRAGAGAIWDLKTNNRRPNGWTSTDAAGLAVLAGLVRPDEVFGPNPINHALRFSIKKTNGYVWPASHKGSSDAGAPPLGMRLRLKASKDLSAYPPEIRKIFQAMKDYGLILADRGGNMYIQGVLYSGWDNSKLNPAFHGLNASDFEVIQLGWRP